MDRAALRYWRLARGLTQRELAARAGTTHAAISQMERGPRQPRPGLLVRLADALGVAPEALLQGGREPNTP